MGNFFSKKITPNKFKTCLHTFKNFFGQFWEFKSFSIFFRIFSQISISRLHWARKVRKSHFGTSFDTFGNFFGRFGNSEVFPIFWIFLRLEPPSCTGQKFSRRKNYSRYAQLMFGYIGNVFGQFQNFNFFLLFLNFLKSRTSTVHWADFFLSKKSSKETQIMCGHFWDVYGQFWKIEQLFFPFFEFSPSLDPPGCTGKKNFSKKDTSKHVQNKWGHFWEHFWSLEILKYFPVFWISSESRPFSVHWAKCFFRKIHLKIFSKLVSTLLRTFWTLSTIHFFFEKHQKIGEKFKFSKSRKRFQKCPNLFWGDFFSKFLMTSAPWRSKLVKIREKI